jgi:NAD(P)-dependent dehydrogenase (short-subunit alcohol dehydrogenase family)
MKDFRGKTAFVTGGASGIGLGLARAFGREGMNVVLADIEEKAVKTAAEQLQSEQIKATPIVCDVAERDSVREAALAAIAAYGKIHVVCNNAGVGGPSGVIGVASPAEWDWVIDVNLKGVIYGMETLVPLIRSHGEGGHIVNTASLAGLISGPGLEPYNATKHAVVTMTEGWNAQLEPQGIGVSVLCPGYVRTNIASGVRNRQARYATQVKDAASTAFLGQAVRELLSQGLDPDIVGALVVESIRNGQLYIITDPRWLPFVEARFARIRAGFEASANSETLKAVKTLPQMPQLPQQGSRQ